VALVGTKARIVERILRFVVADFLCLVNLLEKPFPTRSTEYIHTAFHACLYNCFNSLYNSFELYKRKKSFNC
jgi:hypothetical protein